MQHTVTLATESGTSLSTTDLRTRSNAFVLLSGGENAGSIFGPFPVPAARFVADQAQSSGSPYLLLSDYENSHRTAPRLDATSLVTRRF